MKLIDAVVMSPPKCLLYGLPGSGKTALALTYGAEAEIIDLDRGLRTGVAMQDVFTQDRLSVDVTPCYDDAPDRPTALQKAKTRIFQIAQLCGSKQYNKKLVILDSLTTLGEHSMRAIRASKGKLNDSSQPTQPEWGLAINDVEVCLSVLRSLPIAVIVIGHELTDVRESKASDGSLIEQRIVKVWALGAKLPDKVPAFFEEIWYSRMSHVAGGRIEYILQTKATPGILARSRSCLKDPLPHSLGMKEIIRQCTTLPTTLPTTPPVQAVASTVSTGVSK